MSMFWKRFIFSDQTNYCTEMPGVLQLYANDLTWSLLSKSQSGFTDANTQLQIHNTQVVANITHTLR